MFHILYIAVSTTMELGFGVFCTFAGDYTIVQLLLFKMSTRAARKSKGADGNVCAYCFICLLHC